MQYFTYLRDLGCDVYYLEDLPARFVGDNGHKVVDIDSRAEFLAAKNGYLTTRSDWFSNRSVCYLAAGRPVSMQDTGLDDWIPTGEGIVTATNPTEANEGIEPIKSGDDRNRRAARCLAEQYFAVNQVVPNYLETAVT